MLSNLHANFLKNAGCHAQIEGKIRFPLMPINKAAVGYCVLTQLPHSENNNDRLRRNIQAV